MEIKVRNVNHALPRGIDYLLKHGIRGTSRNGEVLSSPEPVTTIYERPYEKILILPLRDANPFFHLLEALWMLAGRDDVEFLARLVPRMREFSDNGFTFHGAYGARWRERFGVDQISHVISELSTDPHSRRAVIAMWDPEIDIPATCAHGKDVPCNTTIFFRVTSGWLDMTVLCRSNDLVWGAYGANAVHFAILQEYVAGALDLPVGRMFQVSNNLHLYTERPDVMKLLKEHDRMLAVNDPYEFGFMAHGPLMMPGERATFDTDLELMFSTSQHHTYGSRFFKGTVRPMLIAHAAHKAGCGAEARGRAEGIEDPAWRRACAGWLARRGGK